MATYSNELKEAALESAQEFLNSRASIPGNQNSECPFALQSDAVTAISFKTMPTSLAPMDIDPGFPRAGHVRGYLLRQVLHAGNARR